MLWSQVVNSHLVCDPTIWQPGFDLPRQQWSLLNCFRMEQGHCGTCRRKWRLTDTDLCPCGDVSHCHPDDVSHCRILSPDKTEWQLISATHFSSVFTHTNLSTLPSVSIASSLMPDFEITEPGVLKLLNNLDVTKSTGHDSISPRILKETMCCYCTGPYIYF